MSGGQRQFAAAAAYATGQVGKAPIIRATRDSSRIVHRELVDTIFDAVDFTVVKQYALNPGLSASFPWLATQAGGWQSYHFNRLRYCYVTRTGSTTVGSLMLVPDYNASDSVPDSEQIASSYEDCAEDAVWKDITCNLRTKAMDTVGPRHFVRSGSVPSGNDVKLYDVGNLFVCSTGGAGSASIGKLWVEYDVTFTTPQLPPAGFGQKLGVILAGGGSQTAANPFGNNPTFDNFGLAPELFGNHPTNQIILSDDTFANSDYLVVVIGSGTVITAATVTAASGAAVKSTNFQGFPAAATTFAMVLTVTVTDPINAVLTVNLTATTVTACDFTIVQLPPGFSY